MYTYVTFHTATIIERKTRKKYIKKTRVYCIVTTQSKINGNPNNEHHN